MAGKRQTARSTKNDYIPTDYQDLYEYYIEGDGRGNSLTHMLIRKFLPHATEDERETLAQDIYLRIQDKDMLAVFDPSKANFGGVIFFVTRSICVNHLDRKSRNPLTGLNGGSLVVKDAEDSTFEPGVYSMDRLFGTESPNHEERIYAQKIIGDLFAWAKELHDDPRHKRDESLYPLLGMLLQQTEPKECSERLGVTTSTISNWMEVIRKQTYAIVERYA